MMPRRRAGDVRPASFPLRLSCALLLTACGPMGVVGDFDRIKDDPNPNGRTDGGQGGRGDDAVPPPRDAGRGDTDAGWRSTDGGSETLDGDSETPDGGSVPRDGGAQPGPQDGGASCEDACPVVHGLSWQCKRRFALGTNWAWHDFAADFGGIQAWSQRGVAADPAPYVADLSAMTAKKVNVIRWWLFPRLDSSGITFGSDDVPTGIGGSMVADLEKALELAESKDVYLMLTLFSFDNFHPTGDESGVHHVGLRPIVVDADKRKRLITHLVAPVADAVERSPKKARVLAWDIINEPEWAMTGPNPYGGGDFEPSSKLQPVTHAQMETFVSETAAALHAHSRAPVTVGSAAIKWGTAWKQCGLDFYQLHYYDWVYEWFPYTTHTLASAGLTDKPVFMGEFPNAGLSAIASKGLPARTAAQYIADLWDQGYAGALSWAYSDTAFPWSSLDLEMFEKSHVCETKF